jgi:hypothetical protein
MKKYKLKDEVKKYVHSDYSNDICTKDNWISVEDILPNPNNGGTEYEVIGFNKNWIDEDFNPNGTRVCTLVDEVDVWVCAKYIPMHDSYTDNDEAPTHWKPSPNPPKQ